MTRIALFISCFALIGLTATCSSQKKRDNTPELIGTCEGCEAILERSPEQMNAVDTLSGFLGAGTKIKVSGQVFQPNGNTPAPDVVLYVYHTDQSGRYTPSDDPEGWERQHGALRTWLKTDGAGRYTFFTTRPAPYPSRNEAAHIHLMVLEPNGRYYWLGSYYFDDDPLLTDEERNEHAPRGGGDQVLKLKMGDGIWSGQRDIILGKNISGYPDY